MWEVAKEGKILPFGKSPLPLRVDSAPCAPYMSCLPSHTTHWEVVDVISACLFTLFSPQILFYLKMSDLALLGFSKTEFYLWSWVEQASRGC